MKKINKFVKNKKIKKILFVALVFIIVLLVTSIMSMSFYKGSINAYAKSSFISKNNKTMKVFELEKDTINRFNQNYLFFSENVGDITISELINDNPKIKMGAYFDGDQGKRIYYVPFGNKGIGTDFKLEPNITYELFVKDDVVLNFEIE